MSSDDVECRTHGRQPTVVYTRYDGRNRPHDVPDRLVCITCASQGIPPDNGNSLRIGPPDARSRLLAALQDLARHLDRWGEPERGKAVGDVAQAPPEQLAERALALVAGMLDQPLRKRDGRVDDQATRRLELLVARVAAVAEEASSGGPELPTS